MARIRTVKPEFFTSPDTAKLSPPARLLYIAMWCWADDFGKGETNLNGLLGLAFPEADDMERKDVQRMCSEIQRACNVMFYVVEERSYFAIPSWDKHQKTQRRAGSRVPDPDDPRAAPDPRFHREVASAEEMRGASESTLGNAPSGTGEQGNRGTGEQTLSRTGSAGTHDDETTLIPPKETGPTLDDHFQEFWSVYPRRADKQKAIKAFEKATKRANPDTIIRAAAAYRDDPNREDTFTKYPASWLNADAWENDPLPARTTGNNQDRRSAQIVDLVARNMPGHDAQRGELEA